MDRRQFITAVAGLPLTPAAQLGAMPDAQAPVKPFEFDEASISQLQAALRDGSHTAASLATLPARAIHSVCAGTAKG